jgi:AbrB family looped-hinge helix DNA binding protein
MELGPVRKTVFRGSGLGDLTTFDAKDPAAPLSNCRTIRNSNAMAVIITKVGPKCQVTIPKAIRAALKLETGDLLEVRVAGRDVVLKPKIFVDRDP